MGPILSMDQTSAMAPVRGTRPKLGRRPVTPQRVLGDSMLPRVSVPMAKPTQPADDGAAAAGGAAAASLLGVPGIAGAGAGLVCAFGIAPEIALRERAHGELGDEHGAGGIETLDDFGVFVEGLILEAGRAPGGGIAFDGEKVFGSPGDAVKRAAVVAGGEFAIGGGGLCERAVFGEGDDEVQRGVVALEAREVELREVDGGELAVAKKLAELTDGGEGDLLFFGRGEAGDGGCGAEHDGLRRCGLRAGSSGGDGVEDGGGGDAVGEVEFADAECGVALAEDIVEQHLDLLGRELDGGDGCGGLDHLRGDGRPAAEVGLCGRCAEAGLVASASRAPGKSVPPSPAAAETARRRRRVVWMGGGEGGWFELIAAGYTEPVEDQVAGCPRPSG